MAKYESLFLRSMAYREKLFNDPKKGIAMTKASTEQIYRSVHQEDIERLFPKQGRIPISIGEFMGGLMQCTTKEVFDFLIYLHERQMFVVDRMVYNLNRREGWIMRIPPSPLKMDYMNLRYDVSVSTINELSYVGRGAALYDRPKMSLANPTWIHSRHEVLVPSLNHKKFVGLQEVLSLEEALNQKQLIDGTLGTKALRLNLVGDNEEIFLIGSRESKMSDYLYEPFARVHRQLKEIESYRFIHEHREHNIFSDFLAQSARKKIQYGGYDGDRYLVEEHELRMKHDSPPVTTFRCLV